MAASAALLGALRRVHSHSHAFVLGPLSPTIQWATTLASLLITPGNDPRTIPLLAPNFAPDAHPRIPNQYWSLSQLLASITDTFLSLNRTLSAAGHCVPMRALRGHCAHRFYSTCLLSGYATAMHEIVCFENVRRAELRVGNAWYERRNARE
jgi:hypothetical protein